jgi:hypothetical protein
MSDSEQSDDLQPVVLQELTIQLCMSEDQPNPYVHLHISDDDASLISLLGLLEFTKDSIIRERMGEG